MVQIFYKKSTIYKLFIIIFVLTYIKLYDIIHKKLKGL